MRARNVGRGISGELKEEAGERGWMGEGVGEELGVGGGGGRAAGVKPVLNWANVCSPNILRTLFFGSFFFLLKKKKKKKKKKNQYNKYNTIIEHISTPVPTVDNIRMQIYMLKTSIQTKSWTKYFTDRYLPCTKSD